MRSRAKLRAEQFYRFLGVYLQVGGTSYVTTKEHIAYCGRYVRPYNAILGHSLYDLGHETGNEVVHVLTCSYSQTNPNIAREA